MKNLETAIYENYYKLHFSSAHKNVVCEYLKYFPYFKKNYEKFLPENKDARVVDLACGVGHFVYFLKNAGYQNSLGVDASPECIEICKRNGLAVEHSDLFTWLKNNKCDAIIANDVLEHLDREQLDEFFYLAHQSLNSGGVLMIKVPNAANPITASGLRYIDYTHKTSFTELSLMAVLRVYFSKNTVFGQNIFVYYKNPLNYLGMFGQFLFDKLFRVLNFLYGQPELKIYKKSILSVSYKDIE